MLFLASPWAYGCSEAPKEKHLEISQIGDKVTASEFERFLEVVRLLPDGKLPELPAFFGPAPEWNPKRTLPVRDLVKEEQLALSSRWETQGLVKHLEHNRRLHLALRRTDMSLEEFCNLAKALGTALCRHGLRTDQDLENLLEQAKLPMDRLAKDERTFSELPGDEMYDVLRQAIWITRNHRAKVLSQVPPENLALVRKHAEILATAFPRELTSNPFDPLVDILEVKGMPFEEIPESGSDNDLEWPQGLEKRGTGQLDPEFREKGKENLTTSVSPVSSH